MYPQNHVRWAGFFAAGWAESVTVNGSLGFEAVDSDGSKSHFIYSLRWMKVLARIGVPEESPADAMASLF